jgi:tetratricopeptide (TPR) repeat protein
MNSTQYVELIVGAVGAGNFSEAGRYLAALKTHLDLTGASLSGKDSYRLVTSLSGLPCMIGTAPTPNVAALVRQIATAGRAIPPNMPLLLQAWDALEPTLTDLSTKIDAPTADNLLSGLRSARAFSCLARGADQLISRGDDRPFVRSLYAQALIDEGHVWAGIDVLQALLLRENLSTSERNEARGLLGRAHKQIYVDHIRTPAQATAFRGRFAPALLQAIDAYGGVYDKTKPGESYWHGINYIALLFRAQTDGIAVAQPTDLRQLARNMIGALETAAKDRKDAWLIATVGEAYLALGEYQKAAEHFGVYARHPDVNAFMLDGTIRQLEQVWWLQAGPSDGGPILAGLKAAMAGRSDGMLTLTAGEQRTIARADVAAYRGILETMLPDAEVVLYQTLRTIVARGAAVCMIRKKTLEAHGTAFLVNGKALSSKLDDEAYLLTNAHVVSDQKNDQDFSAIPPEDACVFFEADAGDTIPERYSCEPKVVWSSPSSELDATLLKLTKPVPHVTALCPMEKDIQLRVDDAEHSVKGSLLAVIGHPRGQALSLLIAGDINNTNGTLVDMGPRDANTTEPVLLHYRTPTEPGNSGSPVFETRSWDVVALHHAGFDPRTGRPALGGRTGSHMANEGIFIGSIQKAVDAALSR